MDRIALDTNIVSDLLKGIKETLDIVNKYDVLFVPAIVLGESQFGILNAPNESLLAEKFLPVLSRVSILEVDSLVADAYAQNRLQLKKAGRPIPENDIWIAACCLANNVPILTRDQHFNYVEDLEVVSPGA